MPPDPRVSNEALNARNTETEHLNELEIDDEEECMEEKSAYILDLWLIWPQKSVVDL